MKVACLGSRHHVAGASINAVILAEGLSEKGHSAEAWFLYHEGEMPPSTVTIRTFLGHKPRTLGDWAKLLARYRAAIISLRPDCIVGHHPLANALGSLASLLTGAQYVGTQHNPAATQQPILYFIDLVLGSTSLYKANVCVSHAVAGSFCRHPLSYRKRLKVVHNGLRPLPRTTVPPVDSRHVLGLPPAVPLVGNLGRLHHQKNLQFLLDVAVQMPDVYFCIAGSGPDEKLLKQTVRDEGMEDRVLFLGELNGNSVSHFYNAIDAFAFPSKYEGFGMTMIEAMSFGLPVIASNLPVLREVADQAAFFPEMDATSWAQAIRLALSDRRPEFSAAAQKRAKHFSLAGSLDAYEALLLSLCR